MINYFTFKKYTRNLPHHQQKEQNLLEAQSWMILIVPLSRFSVGDAFHWIPNLLLIQPPTAATTQKITIVQSLWKSISSKALSYIYSSETNLINYLFRITVKLIKHGHVEKRFGLIRSIIQHRNFYKLSWHTWPIAPGGSAFTRRGRIHFWFLF